MNAICLALTYSPKPPVNKSQKTEYLTAYTLPSIGGFLLPFHNRKDNAHAKRNPKKHHHRQHLFKKDRTDNIQSPNLFQQNKQREFQRQATTANQK